MPITRARPVSVMEEGQPVGLGWLRDLPDFRDFTVEHDEVKPQLEAIGAALPPGGRFAFTLEEGAPLTGPEREQMPAADTTISAAMLPREVVTDRTRPLATSMPATGVFAKNDAPRPSAARASSAQTGDVFTTQSLGT